MHSFSFFDSYLLQTSSHSQDSHKYTVCLQYGSVHVPAGGTNTTLIVTQKEIITNHSRTFHLSG